MDARGRREFLILMAAAAPALAARAGIAAAAKIPRGLPDLPGGPVFEPKDSGGFVVYDAHTLEALHAGSHRLGLPDRSAPGSITKTFCADAALRNGLLGPDETLLCDGDGFAPSGHGPIGVVDALAVSCNTFFEKVGARLDRERFRETCRLLGGMDARLPDKPAGREGAPAAEIAGRVFRRLRSLA